MSVPGLQCCLQACSSRGGWRGRGVEATLYRSARASHCSSVSCLKLEAHELQYL